MAVKAAYTPFAIVLAALVMDTQCNASGRDDSSIRTCQHRTEGQLKMQILIEKHAFTASYATGSVCVCSERIRTLLCVNDSVQHGGEHKPVEGMRMRERGEYVCMRVRDMDERASE